MTLPGPSLALAAMGRVFITVAEVSGDRHAAQLVRRLRELDPSLIVEGLGGPEMAAAGAIIYRNTVEKAAMGWRGRRRCVRHAGVYSLFFRTHH